MKIWVWWLSFISIMILLTGILITSLSVDYLFISSNNVFFIRLLGLLPQQSLNRIFWWIWFFYGLLSIGLGSFLFYVALKPFKNMEKWAWLAVFISVMIWFTLGATISILFLIYIDMIIFSSILILTLLPLLFTQKAFIIRRDLI